MDFLQRIIEIYKEGNLDFPTLSKYTSLLPVGGSETTATLLAGAVYFLAKDPKLYGKPTNEINLGFSGIKFNLQSFHEYESTENREWQGQHVSPQTESHL